jgi:hypothetical protein
MTGGFQYGFYVQVVLEAEADVPVAEIGYRGEFAYALEENGELVLVIQDRDGEDVRRLPLLAFVATLNDVAARLAPPPDAIRDEPGDSMFAARAQSSEGSADPSGGDPATGFVKRLATLSGRLATLSDRLVVWVVDDGPEGLDMPKPDVVGACSSAGLLVRSVRGGKSRTVERMFDEVSAAWQFPDYFGENWPALNECIAEMDWLDPGRGIVFVVREPELFLVDEPAGDLADVVDVLIGAHDDYRQAIARGAWWDRAPVPFHVVLLASSDQRAATVERWGAAGASLRSEDETGPPL